MSILTKNKDFILNSSKHYFINNSFIHKKYLIHFIYNKKVYKIYNKRNHQVILLNNFYNFIFEFKSFFLLKCFST